MATMSHQIQNINKDIEIIKKELQLCTAYDGDTSEKGIVRWFCHCANIIE